MARPAHLNRFTVFDAMEARGAFSANAANRDSVSPLDGSGLYAGPVEFPKLLYHPKGEERITTPEIKVTNPTTGIEIVETREQREIIWVRVLNEVDETKLLAEGWHTHPAKAMVAAGKKAPPISPDNVIQDLEAEIKKLQKMLEAGTLPSPVATGGTNIGKATSKIA